MFLTTVLRVTCQVCSAKACLVPEIMMIQNKHKANTLKNISSTFELNILKTLGDTVVLIFLLIH